MNRFVSSLVCVLSLIIVPLASAQKTEDFKPGRTFPPGGGYTPDSNKVVYVIFWHHKERVTERGFQDFFMNADGVNDTTAEKMVRKLEEKYPNFRFYKKETNERDVMSVVERERNRVIISITKPEAVELDFPSRPFKKVDGMLVINESAPRGHNDLSKAIVGRWESRYVREKLVPADTTLPHHLNVWIINENGTGESEASFVRDGKKEFTQVGKLAWQKTENGISMTHEIRGKTFVIKIKDLNDGPFKDMKKVR